MSKIAVTTGDPNGIGAEITIKALNKLDLPEDKIVIISNKKIIDFYGKLNRNYDIIEIPYEAEIEPGKVTKEAGEFSFQSVKLACEIGAKAIVTAPVAKNALYLAGHRFNGQTEILQKYLAHNNQLAEMLFVAGKFRVLLLTRHVALKDINLTKEMVVEKITNLKDFFVTHLNISKPEFALCAFNPHAGEDGILGHEEIDILIPAVEELRAYGINITNPLPADTLFIKALDYDCCIANYHDQGLIPIKTVAGDKTVNMTIGLDIIRTSPGHGTAFDIAGKNVADETGMIEAIKAVL
ncbi:4-hydroxythreonine-4-phosphate dehydrogenase 1 [Clostridium sp. CAG:729]|nr:4-hydroxythreonine-4-phosphate dehydrogenase 1 [Clostridium sp. CAG:729]